MTKEQVSAVLVQRRRPGCSSHGRRVARPRRDRRGLPRHHRVADCGGRGRRARRTGSPSMRSSTCSDGGADHLLVADACRAGARRALGDRPDGRRDAEPVCASPRDPARPRRRRARRSRLRSSPACSSRCSRRASRRSTSAACCRYRSTRSRCACSTSRSRSMDRWTFRGRGWRSAASPAREMTLASDQENALAFADADDDPAVDAYFERVATDVNRGLIRCGFGRRSERSGGEQSAMADVGVTMDRDLQRVPRGS